MDSSLCKRDGNIYNFNLINTKYIPSDINKTAFLPIEPKEIMLVKGISVEESLIIGYLKKLNLNNISGIKKYSYRGENFFYCKECKFLIYPKKRIVFLPVEEGFDIKFFGEIVRE